MANVEELVEECQGAIRRAFRGVVACEQLTKEEFLQMACLALERAKEDYHQQYIDLVGEDEG